MAGSEGGGAVEGFVVVTVNGASSGWRTKQSWEGREADGAKASSSLMTAQRGPASVARSAHCSAEGVRRHMRSHKGTAGRGVRGWATAEGGPGEDPGGRREAQGRAGGQAPPQAHSGPKDRLHRPSSQSLNRRWSCAEIEQLFMGRPRKLGRLPMLVGSRGAGEA